MLRRMRSYGWLEILLGIAALRNAIAIAPTRAIAMAIAAASKLRARPVKYAAVRVK